MVFAQAKTYKLPLDKYLHQTKHFTNWFFYFYYRIVWVLFVVGLGFFLCRLTVSDILDNFFYLCKKYLFASFLNFDINSFDFFIKDRKRIWFESIIEINWKKKTLNSRKNLFVRIAFKCLWNDVVDSLLNLKYESVTNVF